MKSSCTLLVLLLLACASSAQGTGETAAQGPASLPPIMADSKSSPAPDLPEIVDEVFFIEEDSPVPFWFSADYLFWWVQKGPLDTPLVTTGPSSDPFAGALDQPNTRVLFGGDGLEFGQVNGMRLSGGIWLDRLRVGVEASWVLLEKSTTGFSLASDPQGNPFIARPFVNALTGNENVYFDAISFVGAITGGIDIAASTRFFAWDTNLVIPAVVQPSWRGTMLLGFRQMGLGESLEIRDRFTSAVPGGGAIFQLLPVDPPSFASTFDRFKASNSFYGPQIGGRFSWQAGRFSVNVLSKLAMGVSQQIVTIDGASFLVTPGAPTVAVPGGILAQTTNIGRYYRDEFAVVPEVGLNLGVRITDRLKAQVGYTFLYWSRVARPGDQIDRAINVNLVPTDPAFGTPGGPARPAFSFHETDFWAQGLNFGFEFSF